MATYRFAAKVQTLDFNDPAYARCRAQHTARKRCTLGSDPIAEYTVELEAGEILRGLNADAQQWCSTVVTKDEEGRLPGLRYIGMGRDLSGDDMVHVSYTFLA